MAGNKRAVLFAAVLAASAAQAAALEVVSAAPSASEAGKKADFVLSGSVTVRNIGFEKGAVVMPATEHNGRTYNDIKILSKALYKKIEACFFKDKCAAAGAVAAPRIALSGVFPLRSPVRIANVVLSFDGDLAVTFGAIKRASGEIKASYPDNFEAPDGALKERIDAEVAKAAAAPAPEVK
ncbi:MAG TPA: hypothetical protein PL037_06885 [Elusimicrobiales bacterium]|nr:hypothetical protein [Elusimicrobiales bacterium]